MNIHTFVVVTKGLQAKRHLLNLVANVLGVSDAAMLLGMLRVQGVGIDLSFRERLRNCLNGKMEQRQSVGGPERVRWEK